MEIWFHSKCPEYGWLSNFSNHPVSIDGIKWPSVEHYYQAQKFCDTDLAERIRNAESAVRTKKLAQGYASEVRADWNEIKEGVMERAVRAKFEQNRKLRKQLLATEQAAIIHRSSTDMWWGRDEASGEGENRLGEILMNVRSALQ